MLAPSLHMPTQFMYKRSMMAWSRWQCCKVPPSRVVHQDNRSRQAQAGGLEQLDRVKVQAAALLDILAHRLATL